MSSEDNKTIARRFIEEVFNERRVKRTDELFARDYVNHNAPPGQAPGLEEVKRQFALYLGAIPDLHATIDDLVAEGDKVVVRYTVEGTQQGELLGFPPTGKRLRVSGISICRMAEGKVAENWEQADLLGLMQQLGVIPTRGQGTA